MRRTLALLTVLVPVVLFVVTSATAHQLHTSVGVSLTGNGRVTSNPPPGCENNVCVNGGINCPGRCSDGFKQGTGVTLTATAGSGDTFVGWGGACSGTGSCDLTMPATDTSFSVSATFTNNSPPPPPPPTTTEAATTTAATTEPLTVARAGTGSGTVTSAPAGIDCGATCAVSFPVGSSVGLTATPADGSAFTGWSGDCSGAAACTVTMDTGRNVTATFATIPLYALSVTKSGPGTGTVASSPAGIDCGAACSASFRSGTLVTLTASPKGGFVFSGWSGACSGTGVCSLTLSAAASVDAKFVQAPDTIKPVVSAIASTGTRGKAAKLRYSVVDDSGKTQDTITIWRGKLRILTLRTKLLAGALGSTRAASWKVPKRGATPVTFRFCVVATDAAGNASPKSCAPLRVKK
jgi:hypothetical protein